MYVVLGLVVKEGMQAVMASDYSIAQFRFLKKLLLVHGRWSYRRISLLILYDSSLFNHYSASESYFICLDTAFGRTMPNVHAVLV